MDASDEHKAPLIEHLTELRDRVMIAAGAWLIAFIGCYLFKQEIYGFLVQPLADVLGEDAGRKMQLTGLTEMFFTYIKLTFTTAFFVAFPVIAYQFYLFLAPGLYKREKLVLAPYLVLSPMLFFAGAALAYFYVMPKAWAFFVGFESTGGEMAMPIELEAKVDEYLSICLQLLFAFGISFQLPIALTLMARVGLVKAETLAKGRRYAAVIIVTAAAILTPPDVISQIALFIPLYLLYEISILTSRIMEKRHQSAVEAEEDIEHA